MDAKEMIMEFLRKNVSDPRGDRTMTAQQDPFSGHTDETEFTLAQIPISHIESVTVDGSAQQKWLDYDIDLGLSRSDKVGKITLHTATSLDVVVDYKTASEGNQWIYPDKPEIKLPANQFPRISVFDISRTVRRRHIGAGQIKTIEDIILQVSVWIKYQHIIEMGDYRYSHNALASKLTSDVEAAFLAYANTELNPQLIFPEGGMTVHSIIPDQDRLNIWHKPIDLNLFKAV